MSLCVERVTLGDVERIMDAFFRSDSTGVNSWSNQMVCDLNAAYFYTLALTLGLDCIHVLGGLSGLDTVCGFSVSDSRQRLCLGF